MTVAYIEGLTAPHLVEEMKKRLDAIDIDGFLSPAAVEEYVTGSRPTAFPLLQYTERADKFCQGLLAGRVGLLVDGLPLGYLAPGGSGLSHDQPRGPGDGLHVRLCRPGASVRRLDAEPAAAGFYVAMAAFHQEMIPLPLFKGHD